MVCPSSALVVRFEPNSTALTSEARETLAAAHNRALQCSAPAFTLLTGGADPLGRDRSRSIGAELAALGLPETTPIQVAIDEPSADGEVLDQVVVFVELDR